MVAVSAVLGSGALPAATAAAQVRLGQEEALRVAFPRPATVVRRTAFLSDEDVQRAERLAGPGVDVDQRVISYYVGQLDGEPLGVAYFDAHRVRTLPEVLMVVVSPDGRIRHIEVLKFSEPPEYLPPDGWLDQFEDRRLDRELSLKGDIVNITGASLTSRAVTSASRRILALHQVIGPLEDHRQEGAG